MSVKGRNKREPILFRKTIPGGASDDLHERIKGDGTIEEMRVRFYPGQQKDLHVSVWIDHKGSQAEFLYTTPSSGERYLSGDDDAFIFPVTIEVEYDDFVRVHVENVDPLNDYDLAVDVLVDYYGGKNRIIGGAIGGY